MFKAVSVTQSVDYHIECRPKRRGTAGAWEPFGRGYHASEATQAREAAEKAADSFPGDQFRLVRRSSMNATEELIF